MDNPLVSMTSNNIPPTYEELQHELSEMRQAAIRMQVAVANVLTEGGLNIDKWWDELVASQRNIAVITRGSFDEFDKYRKEK